MSSLPTSLLSLPWMLLFAAIVCALLGVAALLARDPTMQRRLSAGSSAAVRPLDRPSVRYQRGGVLDRLVRPIENKVIPTNPKERSALRLRLVRAGFPAPSAIMTFTGARLILGLGVPLALTATLPLALPSVALTQMIWVLAFAMALSYLLPSVYVSRRIRERQRQVRHSLPDALDLLLVCIEAGLGLDAAIARVGEEMGRAHPLLCEQFQLVTGALTAGKSRNDALRDLAERVGIEELYSFANLLVQSDELGVSIGSALRVYAKEMRAQRMLRAEDLAQKLSVKLSIVLIAAILPAMLVSICAPAAINAIRAWSGH
jgi:tight adherence protein C